MDYERQYRLLINKAWNRPPLRGKGANHHIEPKCIGGPDIPENKVRLTHDEHFIAHVLLAKIIPWHQGIVFAAVKMGAGNKRWGFPKKINSWRYRWLRELHSEMLRNRQFSPKTIARMRAAKLGKTRCPHAPETKAKMSSASIGRDKSYAHCIALSIAKGGVAMQAEPTTYEVRDCERFLKMQAKISALRDEIGVDGLIAMGLPPEIAKKAIKIKVVDRSPEAYQKKQAEKTREVWAKRRAGLLPFPDHGVAKESVVVSSKRE